MLRSPKSFLICDRNLIIEQILGNSASAYGFSQEDRRIAQIEAESKGFFFQITVVMKYFGKLILNMVI